MDFLTIQNKGLIDVNDLQLIGASTKRDDEAKIGMFGSGWKYALAWLLRNNVKVTIYSGKEEIKITTQSITYRDITVEVLCINGTKTSITTEMGMLWSGWMALREIISNAIDEGDFKMSTTGDLTVTEDKTTIYLSSNPEIEQIIFNYGQYFAFDRPNGTVIDDVTIYTKLVDSPISIYRKGIKCYDSNQSIYYKFDISFDNIPIDENRLCSTYNIASNIRQLLKSENLTKEILLLFISMEEFEGYDITISATPKLIELVKELIKVNKIKFTSNLHKNIFDLIGESGNEIPINNSLYHELVRLKILNNPYDDDLIDGIPANFAIYKPKFDNKKLEEYVKLLPFNVKIIYGVFESNYTTTKYVRGYSYFLVLYNTIMSNENLFSNLILQLPLSKKQLFFEHLLDLKRESTMIDELTKITNNKN